MVGNRDIASAESKPSASIDRQFQLALLEKRLAHGTEDDLKNALRYIYAVLGIRSENIPSGRVKELLHLYIVANYGGHTPAEIRLAFDMAITGRLTVDAECYHDNFTPAYFSRIMNAYRAWAKEEIHRLPPPDQKPVDKFTIDCEYCFLRQREIDKLPCLMRNLKLPRT